MTQYIDKSAVVAEIERRISILKANESNESVISMLAGGMFVNEFKDLLSFIDTLEVKEVDLEKEAELIANSIMIPVQANLYHTNIYNFEKRCFKHSDLKEAAKKGFELGLKAQKGE